MSDSPNDPGYLAPAEFVDSDHPAIISFARETAGSTGTDLERVLRLFHAIRDGIRYDPYMPMSEKQSFRASDCLISRRGWCVPKAALLAACARVIGVPVAALPTPQSPALLFRVFSSGIPSVTLPGGASGSTARSIGAYATWPQDAGFEAEAIPC